MKRIFLKAAVALTAHLVFWLATAEDAAASVLRWRTSGTSCQPGVSDYANTTRTNAGQDIAGMFFFDPFAGDIVGPVATCFVPVGAGMTLDGAGSTPVLEKIIMRMEYFGPTGETISLFLRVSNYTNPGLYCDCDTAFYSGSAGAFTAATLYYSNCVGNPSCPSSWGAGVDIEMTDNISGAQSGYKVRLMSAYSF